ncbi:MAG: DEAD/DEAH box helicase, partial [Propionibacteriaceae bacterium]|nr:DEAD/DEAH box helicase [Propionibacteriaceae bacterium]
MVFERFSQATREWFLGRFGAPTAAQLGAWEAISRHQHTLVVAPTGSGKTLAAFLWALDVLTRPPPPDVAGARVVYISPLKALASDVERNLREPLAGIRAASSRLGADFQDVRVGLRTGDTPAQERRAFPKRPPDILITTPESLYLLLTSRARSALRSVETVIVDEIHALAATKRGAHLSLSLERLDELLSRPAQRIGLSATVRPPEVVARFLTGGRPAAIVNPPADKRWRLRVASPDTASGEGVWPVVEQQLAAEIAEHNSTLVFANSRRLAEKLTARVNELSGGLVARAHHGSVSKQERAQIEGDLKAGRLKAVVATSSLELGIDMGAVDLVAQVEAPPSVASGLQRVGRAGHQVGAVSEGVFFPTSQADLAQTAVVARRMLEGRIEELALLANPLDVLAQQVVAMVAMDDWSLDDLFALVRRSACFASLTRPLLESVVTMLSASYPQELPTLRPRLNWDRSTGLLRARKGAQSVAVVSGGTIPDKGLYGVFLSGAVSADDAGRLGDSATGVGPGQAVDAPRVGAGEARGAPTGTGRGGAGDGRGTLPPPARRAQPGRVGELDEEMVYESRVGDVFALGTSTWRIDKITHDRVLVSPAPGQAARLPFWKGETPGRLAELGRAIGEFIGQVGQLSSERAASLRSGLGTAGVSPAKADPVGSGTAETTWAETGFSGGPDAKTALDGAGLDEAAAECLLDYVAGERRQTGHLPTDRQIVVEVAPDEVGDWTVVVLSCFGGRVNAPWSLLAAGRLRERFGVDVQAMPADDGMVFRLPAQTRPLDAGLARPPDQTALFEAIFPEPENVFDEVREQLTGSALFAAHFRECAGRALLLPRRRPNERRALWQQRLQAAQLLESVAGQPDFPIIAETLRECLNDVFDLPALGEVLAQVRAREIQTVCVELPKPSSFASGLLFTYVGQFLYNADAPLAERRAAALRLDPELLSQLFGADATGGVGQLLDPAAVEAVEAELQQLTPGRRARDADELHDLLRALGPLTEGDVVRRVASAGRPPDAESSGLAESARSWLRELAATGRAFQFSPSQAAVERSPDAGSVRSQPAAENGPSADARWA